MRGRRRRSTPSPVPFKRGDVVYVISGDDRGRTGKVLQVLRREGRVVVEGINLVRKHLRKSPEHPKGAIVSVEAPLPACKLRRFDPERASASKKTG
ncbi:MAG: 50S ribosomal protein L24 [Kiritimatiellae bacterium]|nr:50S ribosomal protein L24 [Kiritimatiellia bacterium]